MPDPIVGTVGGALISGSSARREGRRAEASEAAALAFEQERYDDWKEIYGPIQENLAQYFGGLTPEYYEVQGLEAFEQERELAFKNLEETLAQRGISDSGVAAGLLEEFELEGAEGRARIRTAAPAMAAEEQMRFLQVGLGSDPSGSMSQALQSQAAGARARASQAGAAAGEATGLAVTEVGTALSDYYNQGLK